MKAYIGPYKNWVGPHQVAQAILFWIPKKKDEYGYPYTDERVYKFGEWLAHGSIEPDPEVGQVRVWGDNRPNTWFYKLLLWIDSKKKRNIKVRIDRWDTWSMDDTLSHIILPMLKKLRDNKHGATYVDDADVPEHLRSTNATELSQEEKNVCAPDNNHFLRWDYVLDEMIFAFETKAGVLQGWEDQFTTGEYDLQTVLKEDGLYEVVNGPNMTAKTDWDGHKMYANRIQNGCRLFGKYYQNLWT